MVELVARAKRLAHLFRPVLGILVVLVVIVLVIPIGNSLWAQRLVGQGTVHTGSWDHGCTYTQGYWRNHPEAWPQDEIEIGGMVYSDAGAIVILETPPGGDATYILAHQLIAAAVNILNGADASAVAGTIKEANAWLQEQPLGSNPGNPERDRGIGLSVVLTDYNEGRIGPGHCNDDEDPLAAAMPTTTETSTATSTGTSTATATATSTASPTRTPTATVISSAAPTPTSTPSPTSSETPTSSPSPTPTETSTSTAEPSSTSTDTPEPTAEPTATETPKPTSTEVPPQPPL